jgi:hypothetical protein
MIARIPNTSQQPQDDWSAAENVATAEYKASATANSQKRCAILLHFVLPAERVCINDVWITPPSSGFLPLMES